MKPSDRIEEIYKTKGSITTYDQDYINAQVLNWLNSITEYLDEEWEKKQNTKEEPKD